MAKNVVPPPEWLKANRVEDICSVSSCVSNDFADYTNYWKHNGWWFFNSPKDILALAKEHEMELAGSEFFYYEAYPLQFDNDGQGWTEFSPVQDFRTEVESTENAELLGYDVVTFSAGPIPECSPLSCNHLAETIITNEHCLLSSIEQAKNLLEGKEIKDCEPGPYRIIAVYRIQNPNNPRLRTGRSG